ncbi:MAG: DUF4340 domain-containing protein [Maricaulaceae bacterium]|nr:DUF4340 domain-containing protein [Maricaulaceae bacterium]
MSAAADRKRLRQALAAGAAGALALLAGLVLVWRDAAQSAPAEMAGRVLPGFPEQAEAVARYEIKGAAGGFAVVRGAGDGWTLPERGGYPAAAARAERLAAFLHGLEYEGARTRDPARLDRLGLGDPADGGEGVRVRALDARGRALADIVIGRAWGEAGVYVRFAGDSQVYAARGARPDAGSIGDWMALDFVSLGPDAIIRARVRPEAGPAYVLERPGLSARNFVLAEPQGWTLMTAAAGDGVGGALARIRFRDVRPAQQLTGAFAARHEAETFDGLRVILDIHAEGGERWATVSARAAAPAAEARAEALAARAQGWAYLLSDLSAERLTRPLARLADPPAPQEPPEP